MFLPEEILEIKSWIYKAGNIALRDFGKSKSILKSDNTPVTETEIEIEEFLLSKLHIHYPQHLLISEESGPSYEGNCIWALDPIDGTKPYVSGLPLWGLSLGFIEDNKFTSGFYYMPVFNDMFFTYNGKTYLNDNELPLFSDKDPYDSLSFLAVPSNFHLEYVISYPRVQAFGSTAYHFSLLAREIAIGVLTRNIYIWDIAGVLPLVTAMGYEYEYISGEKVNIKTLLSGERTKEGIIATRPSWLSELHMMVKRKE